MAELTVISLGFGVQSFALAAMSALGALPKVDAVIHADTTWEHVATYRYIERWKPWLVERGVNFVEVQSKHTSTVTDLNHRVQIPAFVDVANVDNRRTKRKAPRLSRQCTTDWKVAPVRRAISELLRQRGLKKRPAVVEQWLGISTDEWSRAKDSNVKYIKHTFPLLFAGISRQGCVDWLIDGLLPEAKGTIVSWAYGNLPLYALGVFDAYIQAVQERAIDDYFHVVVAPKSSCTFCPFHGKAVWQGMKRLADEGHLRAVSKIATTIEARTGLDREIVLRSLRDMCHAYLGENPAEDWQQAVKIDATIRHKSRYFPVYLHVSLRPIADAVHVPETATDEEEGANRPDEATCDSGYCFM